MDASYEQSMCIYAQRCCSPLTCSCRLQMHALFCQAVAPLFPYGPSFLFSLSFSVALSLIALSSSCSLPCTQASRCSHRRNYDSIHVPSLLPCSSLHTEPEPSENSSTFSSFSLTPMPRSCFSSAPFYPARQFRLPNAA